MFLVSETFSVSVAATRLDSRGLVLLFAAFRTAWLVVWIIVTTLRARVVEFFEKHDEDGSLMQYHNLTEGVAHRAGFWIFHSSVSSHVRPVLADPDPNRVRSCSNCLVLS